MQPQKLSVIAAVLAFLSIIQPALSVELAESFTDNMVLQRDASVCIWGTGQIGESIEVQFADQTSSCICDDEGRWRVHLKPLSATSSARMLRIRGTNAIDLRNVVVGDVWLAGGQSNMGSKLNEYSDLADRTAPRANYPDLRFFTVPKRRTVGEQIQTSTWVSCSPTIVRNVSAVSYFFGRELHRRLDIPIGVIVCAWGGTYAENWISREQLQRHPDTAPILDRYDEAWDSYGGEDAYRKRLARYQVRFTQWKAKRLAGERAGTRPPEPMGPEHFQRPGGLYHSMFRTITPFTFRGVIFYQGESNVMDDRGYQYRFLLPMLVRQWRVNLEADLPFLIVQLPTARAHGEEPWAEIRESQWVGCRETPGCELAVVIEFGEPDRLHPKYKTEVGQRLADLAQGKVYGQLDVCEGPLYRDFKVMGNRIILHFDSVGGGLVARDGKLTDFTIADARGKFVPADAIIDGPRIIVSADAVTDPVAVRYGWKNYFRPSLFNQEGFSATPFRTDDFELETQQNR